MSLATALAPHGIHHFHDRADYLVYIPAGQPVPSELPDDALCVQGDFKGKHKARMWNLDQAFNGAKFDARDYPSIDALAADMIREILTANRFGMTDEQRKEYGWA